jgi:hypothetical protein
MPHPRMVEIVKTVFFTPSYDIFYPSLILRDFNILRKIHP